jgi:hypothetical protein
MNQVLVFFVVAILVVVAIKIAQVLYEKVDKAEKIEVKKEEETQFVYSTPKEDYKEVLKKENCSSSRKSYEHYNKKQNLTKFNQGTYRDEKGRFQSTKQWKKEQKTS